MGRIMANIKVEKLMDVLLAERGDLSPEQVRSIEIEALVDTGATLLCLPSRVIRDLGLSFLETRTAYTATGRVEAQLWQGARLTILGRTCTLDVMEVKDGVPTLVGYVPLENLDLQPDPRKKMLTPGRGDGDEIVMDLFSGVSLP